MYSNGTVELQSTKWAGMSNDRPCMNGVIKSAWSGERNIQLFLLKRGLLAIDLGPTKKQRNQQAAMMGGILGGAIGAVIVSSMTTTNDVDNHPDFSFYDEERLIGEARKRKKSFVALADDLRMIRVLAPSFMDRLFGSNNLAGWIVIHEKTIGKKKIAVVDPSGLQAAIESMPLRYPNRVSIECQLNPSTLKFERC